MEFRIDPASREPLYRQLVGQVRRAVAQGGLTTGEQLPSVRELARRLVVNPNTVARAYLELERLGVLLTRPGLGVFVAQPGSRLSAEAREARLVELLDRVLTEAVLLGFTAEEVRAWLLRRIEWYQWQESGSEVATGGE